ncbi:polyprenyl synthetase family protein [Gemmatimonadota bacterium]
MTVQSVQKTSNSDPAEFLQVTREAVNQTLADWSDRVRMEFERPVGEAIAYSLATPGKRLRPALLIAAYETLGGAGDVVELATAVEVLHTYSLVHDDLPCMDDDDLRRGRPSTHCQFDVPTATEAGFRMVPLAARVLASGGNRLGLSAAVLGSVGGELFQAVGASGMVGGQVLDLEAENRDVSLEELMRIHRAKTGALITACGVMGAMAAGADNSEVEAVRSYGQEIGLAFQIVDDILDATATSSELGKTVGKDAEQNKATYPGLLGMDAAKGEAETRVRDAVDHLTRCGIDSMLLGGLAKFVANRRY